eukprot:gene12945-8802_t
MRNREWGVRWLHKWCAGPLVEVGGSRVDLAFATWLAPGETCDRSEEQERERERERDDDVVVYIVWIKEQKEGETLSPVTRYALAVALGFT